MPTAVIPNAKEQPTRETVRVLLVPYGHWKGHHAGEQTYGPAKCAAMVAYFDATAGANGKAVVIDYGHQSLEDHEAPAAGWIWSVELDEQADPPGIYGSVEWTPRAADAIKGNEYRYISPVIVEGMPDPVSGLPVPIQLFNAALTNIPFMADKMNAVSASMEAKGHKLYLNSITLPQYTVITNQGGVMDPAKLLADLMAAAQMPPDGDPNELKPLIDAAIKLKDIAGKMGEAMEAPEGGELPTDPAAIAAAMPAVAANAAHLMNTAKLLSCKPGEVMAKVAALSNTAAAAPDAAKLNARIAELEKAASEAKADAHIAANEGRIQPVHRQMYRDLLVKDFENTAKIIATLPELPSNAAKPAVKANASDVPDEITKHYRDALGTNRIHAKNNSKKEA